MEFTPAQRHVLTAIATAVATIGALVAGGTIGDVPEWVGVAITVLGTIFAALGIVPGQVGGTQEGVVNPSLRE